MSKKLDKLIENTVRKTLLEYDWDRWQNIEASPEQETIAGMYKRLQELVSDFSEEVKYLKGNKEIEEIFEDLKNILIKLDHLGKKHNENNPYRDDEDFEYLNNPGARALGHDFYKAIKGLKQ